MKSGHKPDAPQARLAELYDDLRAMASDLMRRERIDHTYQPTALVHEAYLRFAGDRRFEDIDRQFILRNAARVMREVLIDHARRKKALKRGGALERGLLDTACLAYEENVVDLLAVDEALGKLGRLDPEAAGIVEMRFFGGLTEQEVAEVLGLSSRTVRRGWRAARIWLARELQSE